jgi:hypothetical protein
MGGSKAERIEAAADRMAAVIGSLHVLAAVSVCFAALQLIRRWLDLRALAGAMFALLLILIVHGVYYRTLDLPDMQREFQQHREPHQRRSQTRPIGRLRSS